MIGPVVVAPLASRLTDFMSIVLWLLKITYKYKCGDTQARCLLWYGSYNTRNAIKLIGGGRWEERETDGHGHKLTHSRNFRHEGKRELFSVIFRFLANWKGTCLNLYLQQGLNEAWIIMRQKLSLDRVGHYTQITYDLWCWYTQYCTPSARKWVNSDGAETKDASVNHIEGHWVFVN